MSFSNRQILASGDELGVLARTSSRTVLLAVTGDDEVHALLNVAECEALILVLQAAMGLANTYSAGDL